MAAALRCAVRRGFRAANLFTIVAVAWLFGGAAAAAQPPADPATPRSRDLTSAVLQAVPSTETATVAFFNRSIVDLRATVIGHTPGERASAAARTLEDLS